MVLRRLFETYVWVRLTRHNEMKDEIVRGIAAAGAFQLQSRLK